ncbi:MAG: hypothetical protein QOI47_2457 [Actinomycetota bacterium]|jgi:predicted nucleotidyltransferase|nr:hypothetical protein [Actinomycetota bacterium]
MVSSPFRPLDVLTVLVDHGVRFVLIGGLAGRAWGSPLVTGDTDVAYARDDRNLERLADALNELDARLRGVEDDVPFLLDAMTLRAGSNFTFATRAGDVDIFGTVAGIDDFDQLWSAADEVDVRGMPVRVAVVSDLIEMKRAAGRPKDIAALEVLGALEEERAKWRGVE